ncbi:MAG: MFS transporter [Actinobacteria bacterium]|nr:MFS transporter [Actinomycetota bacterium]
MSLFARFFRLVWGGEVERALRPVLAVALAGSVAGSSLFTFMGIWAIQELDATGRQLGATFLLGAVLAAASGYLGGHLSDHYGRRRLILFGWGGEVLYIPLFLLVGQNVGLGLGLMTGMAIFGSIGGAADQAMVADLVPPERHEAAYASVRVASNLGVTMGPPLGGLMLFLGSWNGLFIGVSLLALFAAGLAWRFIPSRGEFSPEQPPERGSFGVIVRDRVFLLFLLSGMLAYLVYVAFEVALPISLTDTHGISPSTWGFLVIINPALVTLFQLRLTRRVSHIPTAPKLVAAMLLMGLPFTLLSVSAAIPVIAVVIVVFVIGEMLWVPTSQSVIAGLAPEDVRGAYMGAFGATSAAGFALAPFFGLQVRDVYGDGAMWGMFAAFSVVAAVLGALACRGVRSRPRSEGTGEGLEVVPVAP